jgi:succinate dehydrogenase cytochrome b subunit
MDGVERPLSPHLQVYRWQVTNLLSILHRITGVLLSLGAIILTAWLVALASGPAAYATVTAWLGAAWFKLPLLGFAFAFFFHFANGMRHLAWDMGIGFELSQIRAGGWAVVVLAVIATLAFAALAIV